MPRQKAVLLNNKQFDFGQNWTDYSSKAISQRKVSQAIENFTMLLDETSLVGKSFLDIGFGQGLSILSAAHLGANAIGCDINPKCQEALEMTRKHFPKETQMPRHITIGSILDKKIVTKLHALHSGGYDYVHSWGVLHHTGNMKKAIVNAAGLVAPKGKFIIAIYNKHWSSYPWLLIKKAYMLSPKWLKKVMTVIFTVVIFSAKFIITLKNPIKKERGMSFHYDVIDWIGGYPYEYATPDEVIDMCKKLGFTHLKTNYPPTPTGCNEFIFINNNQTKVN